MSHIPGERFIIFKRGTVDCWAGVSQRGFGVVTSTHVTASLRGEFQAKP